MNIVKHIQAWSTAGVIAAAVWGAGSDVLAAGVRGKITVDGSSTVYPITEAVAEEFGNENRNVRVTVGVSGTGGGFKRFVVGETDISNASRPIKAKEAAAAKDNGVAFIELPVAYDGLTIVVNNDNTWCKSLTVDDVKKMFRDGSNVKTWKDVNAEWQQTPIKFFIPGTDSGTFDYFKEVVAGEKGGIRSDVSVSEDDNVLVRGVSGDKGAIGFFGCAYYFANKEKLRAVAIDGGKGPVTPDVKTISDGSYAPFSRPLFIYVNAVAAKRSEVSAFVQFYLENAPELVNDVKYVPLPKEIYERVSNNFEKGRRGTQFLNDKGENLHGALADIYK